MHSEREQLLAAVRRAPDDETLRLAFADHLDECGGKDATWAEFIRVQVEIEHADRRRKEYAALSRREHTLFASLVHSHPPIPRHVRSGSVVGYNGWGPRSLAEVVYRLPSAGGLLRTGYRYGMPYRVGIGKTGSYAKWAKYLFAWPVAEISALGKRPHRFTYGDLSEWSWCRIHTAWQYEAPDEVVDPILDLMWELYPASRRASDSVLFADFGTERSAHAALAATLLAFGRREFEKHATRRRKRR